MTRTLLAIALAASVTACAGHATAPAHDSAARELAPADPERRWSADEFVMGVDLSYVNQVLDHGGVYRDSGQVRDPYAIFARRGANVVRLRLWHSPTWVRDSIHGADSPLYSGLDDVTEAIRRAHAERMLVNLDFHYSDIWADPGRQNVPAAWTHIRELDVLADSVYAYTRAVLAHLDERGLSPAYVQVGNETNCGMLATGAPDGFPNLRTCDGNWEAQAAVLNAGIRAVREAAPGARIILHVAQPENVAAWFDGVMTAGVQDFDIIGFSYYENWSDVPLDSIDAYIAGWRTHFERDVMIVETAYPWTLDGDDDYGNILGEGAIAPGFPATVMGQRAYMMALVAEVMRGGGTGLMYWEPAWISSGMRDLWGTGSSWENNALFDFDGNAHAGFDWMTRHYEF